MWLASYRLTGIAQQWYYQQEHDEGILSWSRLVDFVNMCFGPPIRSNPSEELTQLRHTGSVEEYQRRLFALLCRTEPLSLLEQVQLFTAGLGNPLKTDVELQHHASLQTAMSLACAYEQRLQEHQPESKLPPRSTQTHCRWQTRQTRRPRQLL